MSVEKENFAPKSTCFQSLNRRPLEEANRYFHSEILNTNSNLEYRGSVIRAPPNQTDKPRKSAYERQTQSIQIQQQQRIIFALSILLLFFGFLLVRSTFRSESKASSVNDVPLPSERTSIIAEIIAKNLKKELYSKEYISVSEWKAELKEYYQEDFSNDLWQTVCHLLESEFGVRQVSVSGSQHWTH